MSDARHQDDEDAYSFVVSSKYRRAAVRVLARKPRPPKDVADHTPFALKHISRALNELRDEDVVELLVDEDTKKGRTYGLTDRGDRVASRLDDDTTTDEEGGA